MKEKAERTKTEDTNHSRVERAQQTNGSIKRLHPLSMINVDDGIRGFLDDRDTIAKKDH